MTTEIKELPDMTSTIPAAPAVSVAKHKAAVTADDLPPIRPQSFVTLLRTELRKSVDTRSGRVLLLGILALALIGLVWRLTHLPDGPVGFGDTAMMAIGGVQLLLPVIGIMAMTSEWTQRTALSTFTLSPRRTRVQLAKFLSAILLGVAVLTAVLLLAAGTTVLGGAIQGSGTTFSTPEDGFWGGLAGVYLTNALNVVMGAAFGAVLAQTAVAIVVYFIAPTAWALGAPALLKSRADWLDVFGAFDRIANRNFDGKLPESLTAVAVWIVIPTIVGLWLSSRREVK
jgi:ABC-type transport system involved in multi-copper enzyme maturation permease subunit